MMTDQQLIICLMAFVCLCFTIYKIVKIITGCKHNYEIINTIHVDSDWGTYTRYHLRCTKCGDVKCCNMK